MCVSFWAEQHRNAAGTYTPTHAVQVLHVTELLSYDYGVSAGKVNITLLIVLDVKADDPVLLHCAHRRHVEFENTTPGVPELPDSCRFMARQFGLFLSDSVVSDGTPPPVKLRKANGETIEAVVGSALDFEPDVYILNPTEQQKTDIVFSSACFGPIAKSDQPYLLSLQIAIEGSSYRRLVPKLRNGGNIYFYGIEGPPQVLEDIEFLDLNHAPEDMRHIYDEPYNKGIRGLVLGVPSYDLITCDLVERGGTVDYYDRLKVRIVKHQEDERFTSDDRDYILNSWHSDSGDFLIQKVVFRPISSK